MLWILDLRYLAGLDGWTPLHYILRFSFAEVSFGPVFHIWSAWVFDLSGRRDTKCVPQA